MHLSWIPNSTLRKHPATLENIIVSRAESNLKDGETASPNLEDKDKKIDVCLEVKEPVSCGDCERICSGGFLRNRVLFREEQKSSSQNGDSNLNSNGEFKVNGEAVEGKVHTTEPRSESLESRSEELKDRRKEDFDRRSLDEDGRDDTSLPSRSMSLTSSCSLSVTGWLINFLFF